MYLKATNVYALRGNNYVEAGGGNDVANIIRSTSQSEKSDINVHRWRLRAKVVYYCSIPIAVLGFILILVDLSKEDAETVSLCSSAK